MKATIFAVATLMAGAFCLNAGAEVVTVDVTDADIGAGGPGFGVANVDGDNGNLSVLKQAQKFFVLGKGLCGDYAVASLCDLAVDRVRIPEIAVS